MRAPRLLLQAASKMLAFVAVLAFVTAGSAAAQDVCYVDTGGNDANDGRSATVSGGSGPKATIDGCVAISAAGDIISIEAGTYAGPGTITEDVILEARQTGSFTRVIVNDGLDIQADAIVRANTLSGFDDGVFRLGDGAAALTLTSGSLDIQNPATGGRVRIVGGAPVTVTEGTVQGDLLYLDAVDLTYNGANDRTAGAELPSDMAAGDLTVAFTAASTLTLNGPVVVGANVSANGNSTISGTLVINDNVTINGTGNVGSLEVNDGTTTLGSSVAVEDVNIANNDDITFTIGANTLTVNGDFERLGGTWTAGGTIAFVGDGTDATFEPGPNFSVTELSVDKDLATLTITNDIDVSASAASAFNVEAGTTVDLGGNAINVTADGIVDNDGSLENTSIGGVVFAAAAASLRGSGTYANILVNAAGDIIVDAEDVTFAGILTLNDGGIGVDDGFDISPAEGASVVINVTNTDTDIAPTVATGTFNAAGNTYNVSYIGTLPGARTVASEWSPDNIEDATFDFDENGFALTLTGAGTLSGDFTLTQGVVNLPAADVGVEGVLTIAAGQTLAVGNAGNTLTLSGDNTSHSIVGTYSAASTLVLDADGITLAGSADDANAAAITAADVTVAANADATISNIQTITAGDLTVNADATLSLTMADEQTIGGNLAMNGAGLTLGSDINVSGNATVTTGTLTFSSNDLTVSGNFTGSADVAYASSGGALVFDTGGVTFGLAGEAIPHVVLDGADVDLSSAVEISGSLSETGAGQIDVATFALDISGTVDSDGGNFIDNVGGNADVTFGTTVMTLGGAAEIDASVTVADGATLTVDSDDDETPRTLEIGETLTLSGTLAIDDNSINISAGDLANDGGSITATDGVVIVSSGGAIEVDGSLTIPNLQITAATALGTTTDGTLTITGTADFDAALTRDDTDVDLLVFADGATIDVGAANPLAAQEPDFAGSVNLIYNVAATTNEEVPDAGEGSVNDLTINAAVQTSQDITVNGTLTLADAIDNTTQTVDLVLSDGATLRLEADNAAVLGAADLSGTNYNLTYANQAADEEISDDEFVAGATVTTLTVDVDGFVLHLDDDRTVGTLVLASGDLDLENAAATAVSDLTVTGDFTFDGGDLINSNATAGALIFAGGNAQAFTLDGTYVVDNIDVTIAKDDTSVVTMSGPSNARLDFHTNMETLYLNGGVLNTSGTVSVFLWQDNTTQGFERNATPENPSHVSGRITKRLLSGDPFSGTRSARFEFPSGSSSGEYRPYALTFRDNVVTTTDITVDHQNQNPGGTVGFPLESGDVQIGNYPDYYWLVSSSTSLGQAQQFDVELTATEIGIPFESDDDLRIIKRFDGSANTNEWSVQGSSADYDNFMVVDAEEDTTVVARVTASQGGIVPQGARFTLGIPVRAPAFTAVPANDSLTVDEGDTLTFAFVADPQDVGETVSYSIVEGPDGLTIDETTGELSYIPGFAAAGEYDVAVRATDSAGSTTDYTFTLTVNNVNRAPEFVSTLPDTTVNNDIELSFQYEATDEDNDELTYSLDEGPDGAEIDSTSGLFTWTPSFDQVGASYDVVVSVTDGEVTATDSAVVTVGTTAARGDANGDGQLTPADASLILSAVVGDTELTAAQEFAAEVSGNGTVGAFDAGLILQCITNNGGLPVDDPSTCNFPADNSGKAGFVATGDLGWGDATSEEGAVVIPLRVTGNVGNVYSVELTAEVDMALVNLRSVESQLPKGWQLAWTADKETGKVRVAAIGGTPISDEGTVAELVFELADSKADVALNGEARVNDNAAAQLGSMAVKEVPTEFALGENYPNPFNPTTTFTYSVPEAARVTIEVYDVSGRLVQTLVDAEMEAGRYEVRWDGRSNAGSPVASGLYMYRMEAGSFTKVKTMMLVK